MRSGSATEGLRHVAIGYQLKRVCQKADHRGGAVREGQTRRHY